MRDERIALSHGSGGRLTHHLIEDMFLRFFDDPILQELNDQAIFRSPSSRIAFTTDSYVVNPIFFPGGDIGKLSVCGTVNDLVVGGAEPLYMSVSFIIEEGLPVTDLERIVASMAETSRKTGIRIVTGDTKVVERNKGDKIFINTTGIGVVRDGIDLSPRHIKPGDVIIVSGTIGDHGIAILTHREGIGMETPVESDCAPLNGLVRDILDGSDGIRAMRDPTRGGLATVLNEFAHQCGLCILVKEEDVPVRDEVRGACEILGFDPLYLANEGKIVVVASEDEASGILDAMRKNPLGREASIIGRVLKEPERKVLIETPVGNRRILDMPSGEQLPRIC